MRTALTLILLYTFGCSISQAKRPEKPYNYPIPNIESRLPFSLLELNQFKTKTVKEVELSINGERQLKYIISYDTIGFIRKIESISIETNKKLGEYHFNSLGLPTMIKNIIDEGYILLDTISYDERGFLSHYNSTDLMATKKKYDTIINWDLKLNRTCENWNILSDENVDGRYFFVSKNNTFNKVKFGNRTDSMYTELRQNDSIVKFVYHHNGEYHLGSKRVFSNDGIDTIYTYDEYYPDIISNKEFFFFIKEQCIRKYSTSWSHETLFYTYYDRYPEKGLLKEAVHLSVNQKNPWVISYSYKFL